MMKTMGSFLLAALFCVLPHLAAQQTSPNTPNPNPQDVPQQQPPATNSPDIMKQRRPAPDSSQGGNSGDNSSKDVPKQEPGTNNPDVGKQRHDDKGSPSGSGATDGQGSNSKKKSKGHKRNSSTAHSSSPASV